MVAETLDAWLGSSTRDGSTFSFRVTDLAERSTPDDAIVELLGQLVLRCKTDPAVVDRMSKAIGWRDAASRLRKGRVAIRRGDFGEAVASQALEDFGDYVVPIRKLRYQADPEDSLHGTDIVGFRFTADGQIEELHFLECKLRTFRDLVRAVEAHKQLSDDRMEGFADSIMFLADRLSERDPELFTAFESYLANRERTDRGTYGIALVWERERWDEEVLERLEEVENLLDPLHVQVMQVSSLADLVERAYDSIGAEVELDDS